MRKELILLALAFAAAVCRADGWSLERRSCATAADRPPTPPVPALSRGEADTNRIDLLVVFDASVRGWLDGHGFTPDAYAHKCIADLNASLALTGIDRHFSFRLAGVLDLAQCDFGEYELASIIASFANTLAPRRLDRTVIERICRVRDERKADIVAVLTAGVAPNKYGDAAGMNKEALAADVLRVLDKRAYCACRIDSVDSRHTLLHEIGHLLGAGHSDQQKKNAGPQLFAYSSAFRFLAGDTPLTTVTGYPETKDGTILPFFSSPDYALTYTDGAGTVYRDIPVGTPTNDNTRTVIATFPLVAQYRVANPTEAFAGFEHGVSLALAGKDGAEIDLSKPVSLRCGVRCGFAVRGVDGRLDVEFSFRPPGLDYSAAEGALCGAPRKPGAYSCRMTAEDPASGFKLRKWLSFDVKPLPPWATGSFADDTGALHIHVSDSGRVQLKTRHSFKSNAGTQNGFLREETADDGSPVFVFEDGKRLRRVLGEGGVETGIIEGLDGLVCRPARPRAGGKRQKGTKNEKRKRRT